MLRKTKKYFKVLLVLEIYGQNPRSVGTLARTEMFRERINY